MIDGRVMADCSTSGTVEDTDGGVISGFVVAERNDMVRGFGRNSFLGK